MIKILVAAAALTSGLAGYAVAQESPPATPEQNLPPHHPLRHAPRIILFATFRPTIRSAIIRSRPLRRGRRNHRPAFTPKVITGPAG